jgi:monoamine oxidase
VGHDRAFWRERGLRGEAWSTGFPCHAYLDNCGDAGSHPALVGFVVGSAARRFAALTLQQRKEAVLAQLPRLFGDDAGRPGAYLDHNWMAEE